jgi:hypothetical protein
MAIHQRLQLAEFPAWYNTLFMGRWGQSYKEKTLFPMHAGLITNA